MNKLVILVILILLPTFLVFGCAPVFAPPLQVRELTFEDLPILAKYFVGDKFNTNGVIIEVRRFGEDGGYVFVDNECDSGGTGQDLGVCRATINIRLSNPIKKLSAQIGNFVAGFSIEVNGEHRDVKILTELNQERVGGAKIETFYSRDEIGEEYIFLVIEGDMRSISIGGSFYIDNINVFLNI